MTHQDKQDHKREVQHDRADHQRLEISRYSPEALNRMRLLQGQQAGQRSMSGVGLDDELEHGADGANAALRRSAENAAAQRRRAQFGVVASSGAEPVSGDGMSEDGEQPTAQIGFASGRAEQQFEELAADLSLVSMPAPGIDVAGRHLEDVNRAMRAVMGPTLLRLVGREAPESRVVGANVEADVEVVRGLALESLAA